MKRHPFRAALPSTTAPHHLASVAGALLIGSSASSLNAATYMLDLAQTNPGFGFAVWDITDGDYSGTLSLTSTNASNLSLSLASLTDFTFSYDTTIASEYEVIYTASVANSISGEKSKVDAFSLYVGDTAGSEFYFENSNTIFESGNAGYGGTTAMSGNALTFGDSGSGASHAFSVGGGAQFQIVGEGEDGDTFGWSMSFANSLSDPGLPTPTVNISTFTGVVSLEAIPEPSSALLFTLSSIGLLIRRKRSGQ